MKRFPEDVRAAVDGLQREFWKAGRGAKARVTRELGLRRTYFSEKRSRPPKTFDVGALLAALRALGIDAAAFFRRLAPARRGGKIWDGVEPIDERATPATRRAVQLANRRMRAELGIDLEAARLDAGEASEPAAVSAVEVSDPGPTLGSEWLEDLDGRRLTEPETVIKELAEHLCEVEAALLPRALGIWGSALWFLIELEAAAYLNRRALGLAAAAGDETTVADLLIRRSYIMGDAGGHGRALVLAEQAGGIFDRIDDRAGRGRATADQGQWLYYLSRWREADAAHKRALELLPKSLPAYRFAAYSGRCLCCLELGEIRRAQELAGQAEGLPVDPYERGKLSWIRAKICRKLGNRSGTLEHLRRGAETLRTVHHGDHLLISLELAETLLDDGRPVEALEICRSLLPLLQPFERNPIISAALREFVRFVVADRGDEATFADLVRRVLVAVERERARMRHAWRTLAVGAS